MSLICCTHLSNCRKMVSVRSSAVISENENLCRKLNSHVSLVHSVLVWAFIAIFAVTLTILVCITKCKMQKKDGKKGLKGIKELEYVMINEKVQPDVDEVVVNIKDDEDATKSKVKLGKLHFSVDFDFHKEELAVDVIEAVDLPGMDMLGTSDPYVKVYLLPDKKKKHKTKVQRKTVNPAFNETFIFKVPFNEVASKTLTFDIYDFERFSRHGQIGQVQVPLNSVNLGKTLLEWCDLASPENEEKENKLGDICFSLRYLPTTGKLNIIIHEAKNLMKMDVSGLSDPYVKIWLIHNGKRIKKMKTTIKTCTLNPYYDETFTFHVPVTQIRQVTLIITVADHDSIGSSEPIGSVIIGCNSTGTELRLWNHMLANPARPIAQWHTLQEVHEKSLKDTMWKIGRNSLKNRRLSFKRTF